MLSVRSVMVGMGVCSGVAGEDGEMGAWARLTSLRQAARHASLVEVKMSALS